MSGPRQLVLALMTVSLLGLASCQSDDVILPSADQAWNGLSDAQGSTSLRMDVQMFKGPAVPLGNGVARTWVAIDADGAPVSVGGGVSLTALHQHRRIRRQYPALARAAELVSTPLLRNMGTFGGNLCLDTRCNYYNQTYALCGVYPLASCTCPSLQG